MKTIFTINFIISSLYLTLAQTPAPQQGFDPEQNLRMLGNLNPLSVGAIGFDNRYQGIKGTPLLYFEWKWGTIQFTKQDTLSTPFKVNVDLIKNTLLVQLRNGSLGEISAANIRKVQISHEDDTASTLLVASEKEVEGANSVRLKFYEVLYDGKAQLLKSTSKIFKKADYKGAYNSGNTSDEFVTEENYWLKPAHAAFTKIKIRRKDVESALAAQATQVAELTKSHKLNLNEWKDVVQLLNLLEKN